MALKMDGTDRAILDLLRQNGRMSNREVGRALAVSEGTVRQRIKKLVDSKSMRLGLVTDIETSGFSVGLTVRIKALPTRIRDIAQEIAQIDACTFVGLTLGRFDIIAVFVNRSRIEAAEMIDNRVAQIPGIQALDVQEPVSYAKHRYDLVYAV